jgi:hypothetical protein
VESADLSVDQVHCRGERFAGQAGHARNVSSEHNQKAGSSVDLD